MLLCNVTSKREKNKMPKQSEITNFLNQLLAPEDFDDSTYNGLQVEGKSEIKKVGFSVDTAEDVLKSAVAKNCDMLVVHHGLIWGGLKKIIGAERRRLEILFANNLNLYVSHLPLDKHSEVGNNVSIIRELGAEVGEEFNQVGYIAEFQKTIGYPEFLDLVKTKISDDIRTMDFGEMKIDKFAVSSGGFSSTWLDEAINKNISTILTGEGAYESLFYYVAKENCLNIIFAGHYATEVFGVKNLMRKVKNTFGVDVEFIDIPTGW